MSSLPLAPTPPMGWNSWNTFGHNINEELIKGIADKFTELGLKDAGYEYVVIDDCWSERERGADGRLVPDKNKFPNGIKPVADYVHSKGLKFGIYSCAGTHTCAGFPGSFEHEYVDAATFAEWGVDYLKYDYCYKPVHVAGENLYKRMGMALRSCGRDIVFSACNWGVDDVYNWIRESGAQLYRSTGDIRDNWQSIKHIALSQLDKQCYSGTYCWNDMDMLVVGMCGKGDNAEVIDGMGKLAGCTDTEYKTHFALWAMMNSPLMIGCDIRRASEEALNILKNPDVIAINQDPEGRGPFCIRQWNNPDNVFALIKPLCGGDYAIGMYNLSDNPSEMSLQFFDIGLPTASGLALEFYNCHTKENEGKFTERRSVRVEPHDCYMYRCKVVKA
ncbi:MAG: glycoside hydrolase family 27 protein [Oscillospiraceae bacterium]|nr:glycoside hydrolase family 27 protein [Oscillospiraceae bacterium]